MRYFLSIICLILVACSTATEQTLAEFMKIRQHGAIYSGSEFRYGDNLARINEAGEIYGYVNNGRRFFTSDDFWNVEYSSKFNLMERILLDNGRMVIKYDELDNEDEDIVILVSKDNGFTFTNQDTIPQGYRDISRPFYQNESLGWYFQKTYGGYREYFIEVHRIKNGKNEVVAKIPSPRFEECGVISFLDENTGWLSVEKDFHGDILLIYKTTDGGVSWEGPFELAEEKDDGNTSYQAEIFKPLSENKVLIQSVRERANHFYVSSDGGETWRLQIIRPEDLYPSDFHVVDSDLVYAVTSSENHLRNYNSEYSTTGYLYKSRDLGVTWEKVTGKNIYTDFVYFLNEDVGLVTAKGVVQKTMDGGKTWFVPVFPLDEE